MNLHHHHHSGVVVATVMKTITNVLHILLHMIGTTDTVRMYRSSQLHSCAWEKIVCKLTWWHRLGLMIKTDHKGVKLRALLFDAIFYVLPLISCVICFHGSHIELYGHKPSPTLHLFTPTFEHWNLRARIHLNTNNCNYVLISNDYHINVQVRNCASIHLRTILVQANIHLICMCVEFFLCT